MKRILYQQAIKEIKWMFKAVDLPPHLFCMAVENYYQQLLKKHRLV